MRQLVSQRGKGFADRRGGRGNRVENRKKILNRGNEPKDLLKKQDLAFFRAKNELKTNPILSANSADPRRINGFQVAGYASTGEERAPYPCGQRAREGGSKTGPQKGNIEKMQKDTKIEGTNLRIC
jgi:hypothetical protein